MKIDKVKKRLKAFTLIEILTVLTLIGGITIFSSVAIPKQLMKARDAVRKNSIRRVASAIEEYHEDENCYPVSLPVCGNSFKNEDLTLINSLPCDPKTKNSYVYVAENKSCPSWFQLYGNLEYTLDSIIDKVGCRNGCGPDCQFNFGIASTNQVLNPFCEQETPTPIPTPGASPTPTPVPKEILQYVCAPGGDCEVYIDPELSGCPDIYPDDPTCQDKCSEKIFRCHDARGKVN